MTASRRLAARLLGGCLLAAVLAGCATPQRAPAQPGVQVYTGRLALAVSANPPQAFSAGFELKGAPEAGELTLYSPLGGTLAVLGWTPGSASLKSGHEVRQFASLDALASEVTGTELPVAALFDWLGGKATAVAGWQADVSEVANGRLRAQRTTPAPAADLRIAFDNK
ncbi:MAG: outer rane lipoLolB family protein [Ramlibacter sp.]|jgi:outer membrane lipoprotein LolB|uniref:lipoprotein insertase outer membrane protein LolB n=1 Tax=Ramlibacter sp. TaxID=1917967 RepID=UPI0026095D50|nr:lipoprotein insertase outer membrane protein LolB [Ramlibacter sp.]MDB5753524.1 outer rane lipoLolB family protein [Ramlibacter sp.]